MNPLKVKNLRMRTLAMCGLVLGAAAGQSMAPPHLAAQNAPPVNAATFHYDNQRTGWNANETTLTPDTVAGPNFGPLWDSPPLDSVTIGSTTYPPHLYATPLYLDLVLITSGPYSGQQFSVVFAATSNDFVYAINAFDVAGPPAVPAGTILWSRSLGTPTNFGLDGGVAMGILGTPVIDPNASVLYVAADAITDTPRNWKVFALDVGSGNILPNWPLTINDSTLAPINQNGPAKFQSTSAMSQRGALNLSLDGRFLYVPFGAYGDGGAGWMVVVDTTTPALASAFSGAPSTVAFANGGMWGSGGPAIDLSGNVYDTTGNSPQFSEDSPRVWGESLLVWSSVPTVPLQLAGTYTPWNYCQMDIADTDLAGSTPVIIPDLDPSTTSTPHLVTFASKQGNVYLVDRDNLPGRLDQRPPCSGDASTDPSLIPPDPKPYYGSPGPLNVFGPYSETCTMGNNARMRTTPAYFQAANGTNYVFVSGATKQSECSVVPVPPGLARLAIVTSPNQPAYLSIDATDSVLHLYSPGPPIITSNGSSNPIAWVLDANVYRGDSLVGPNVHHPILYAFDATTTPMQRLWQSTPTQLNVGGKYNHAVVAHGAVFVGTDRIQAFGMTQTANPVRINAGGSAVGPFLADTDFVGGHADIFTDAIDLSGVSDPAPQAVYQSKRTDGAGFTYVTPNLAPAAPYLVRLHFAENVAAAPGQRVFNVAINATTVLSDFDVFQAAGGRLRALVEEFQATPDSNNQIVIQYVAGRAGNALANGIEIVPVSPGTQ